MIKKLIIRSSVLLLFGIIESILAVQNMELVEFCKTTALPVPGPTKESRDIPVISNRRLLI